MIARIWRPIALFAGVAFTALALAVPAMAQPKPPLSVTVTSASERSYDVSVGTRSPFWWVPSVGTSVGFEVAANRSPAAGRIRAAGGPSGTLWGTVVLPKGAGALGWDTTEIRVQMDPQSRESAVSFSGRKTWKLGKLVSVSVEDSYTLTSDEDAVLPDWSALTAVRLEVKPTRTAFVAQNSRNPDDGDWQTSIRAEQQIGDGFAIAASLDDLTSNDASQTFLASFSREW